MTYPRSRSGGLGLVVIAAMLLLLSPPAAAETFVTDLPLANGGMQRVLYTGPENPRAALIMLPGGYGMVEIGQDGAIRDTSEGFLFRTPALWQSHGFAVVVTAPPNGVSLLGYRHTRAYAAAIGQFVDFVRNRVNVPVWLVGTSHGAIAAVNGGARLGDKIAGIVVASSITRRNNSGEMLFDSKPGRVQVPVLIVANRGDNCPVSPPRHTKKIAKALARAPRKDIVYMESSAIKRQPCGAMSPHGYFGIETETVARITDWIGATSGR